MIVTSGRKCHSLGAKDMGNAETKYGQGRDHRRDRLEAFNAPQLGKLTARGFLGPHNFDFGSRLKMVYFSTHPISTPGDWTSFEVVASNIILLLLARSRNCSDLTVMRSSRCLLI
jgi:hypothetical protein